MWTRNLSQYNRVNLCLWLALSFQAGMINVGALLACHHVVTHTTGFASQFGASLAEGPWLEAFGILAIPLFFLGGAMLSGFFIDRRLSNGQTPLYSLMIGLIAALLLSVFGAGHLGFFGVFGLPLNLSVNYHLLTLLAFASGIQNAAVTSASGAVIRTTHLTGLTTDLGIGIVRLGTALRKGSARHEWQVLGIRVSLIGGFILGSAIGAFLFLKFKYDAFLVPAVISCALCAAGVLTARRRRKNQLRTQVPA